MVPLEEEEFANHRLMRKIIVLWMWLSGLPLAVSAQDCFFGGAGAGDASSSMAMCSGTPSFTATGTGKGDHFGLFLPCSDAQRYTSSGTGSGFADSLIGYCPGILNFATSSASGSGISQNLASYCTGDQVLLFQASSGCYAGFNYNKVINCSPVAYSVPEGSSGSGYNHLINPCTVPLPVTLLSFDAIRSGESALIYWITTSEINNDYFVVERSSNADEYSAIGITEGAGNSNRVLHYSMNDTEPFRGINYYRLRQVDYDGSSEYSNVIMLDFSASLSRGNLRIFPNPLSGDQTLCIMLPFDTGGSLEISDTDGRLLYAADIPSGTGINYLLPAGFLEPGVYIIRLLGGNDILTARLIKS